MFEDLSFLLSHFLDRFEDDTRHNVGIRNRIRARTTGCYLLISLVVFFTKHAICTTIVVHYHISQLFHCLKSRYGDHFDQLFLSELRWWSLVCLFPRTYTHSLLLHGPERFQYNFLCHGAIPGLRLLISTTEPVQVLWLKWGFYHVDLSCLLSTGFNSIIICSLFCCLVLFWNLFCGSDDLRVYGKSRFFGELIVILN